jgi:hypothetical protein
VGVGIIGADADGLAIAGLGVSVASHPGQDDAELVVDLEVVGPARQHAAIGVDRGIEPPLPGPDVAEVAGGLDEIGRGVQRRLERRGGAVEVHAAAEEEQAEVVVAGGEVGPDRHSAAEATDGRFEVAGLGVQAGQVAQDLGGFGPQAERLAVADRGEVGPARGAVRRAQGVVMVGLAAVEGDGPAEQLDGGVAAAVLQGEHAQQEDDVGVVVPVLGARPAVGIPLVRTAVARGGRTDHQDIRTFRHGMPSASVGLSSAPPPRRSGFRARHRPLRSGRTSSDPVRPRLSDPVRPASGWKARPTPRRLDRPGPEGPSHTL